LIDHEATSVAQRSERAAARLSMSTVMSPSRPTCGPRDRPTRSGATWSPTTTRRASTASA